MKAVLLAVASGVLFALSIPPFTAGWLGWLALAPLLASAAMPRRRPLHAAGLGLITGVTAGIVQVRWHSDTHALHFAYLPFVWIALLFAAIAALAAVGRSRFPETAPRRWVLFTACAGVAVEWLATFSPLPVGIALCQHRTLPVLQIASITGIWGVSFLLYLTNACLADMALRRRFVPHTALPTALLLLALLGFGYSTLIRQSRVDSSRPRLRVAAIQDYSGIEAARFTSPTDRETDIPDAEALTKTADNKGAELIVWTEGSLGIGFDPEDREDRMAQFAQSLTAPLLVVGFEQSASPKPYNCAALLESGRTVGIHRKNNLFLGERQSIQPGRSARAFDTSRGKVGLLICFDSCYTGLTRQAVASGAQIIAMPNYDPPTPRAVLHHLHAALMPFRAVENRVAFVRADPNGISQIIAPSGRIVAQTPLYRAEALVADVSLGDGKGTFFTRWGDWFAYLCTGVLIGTGIQLKREGKAKEPVVRDDRLRVNENE